MDVLGLKEVKDLKEKKDLQGSRVLRYGSLTFALCSITLVTTCRVSVVTPECEEPKDRRLVPCHFVNCIY